MSQQDKFEEDVDQIHNELRTQVTSFGMYDLTTGRFLTKREIDSALYNQAKMRAIDLARKRNTRHGN